MAGISRILAITAICLSCITSSTFAHPGEHHDAFELMREMRARGLVASEQSESLGACQDSIESRELQERAFQRRAAKVQQLREERDIGEG
jgi:pentatricopeptide repeat protein